MQLAENPSQAPSSDTTTTTTTTTTKPTAKTIARIPLDLRSHVLPIALATTTIFTAGCILPLTLYYTLRYHTTLQLTIVLTIPSVIFGLVSLTSLTHRIIRLTSSTSDCRPLSLTTTSNQSNPNLNPNPTPPSAWTLDYFTWNFIAGFIVVTAVIAAGIAYNKPPTNVHLVSLPLSILLCLVCGQMVVIIPLRYAGVRVPCRISSYGPDSNPGPDLDRDLSGWSSSSSSSKFRPACYTIVEDVVSVDGKQGSAFRLQWARRWESSPEFRSLLGWLDTIWGISGVCVAAVIFGVVFGVNAGGKTDVGWAVGWGLPWGWAGVMALVTVWLTRRMCKRENELEREGDGKV